MPQNPLQAPCFVGRYICVAPVDGCTHLLQQHGSFWLTLTPESSAVCLLKDMKDGIGEAFQPLDEGRKGESMAIEGYMGIEGDSQNKDNLFPYEASQIQL